MEAGRPATADDLTRVEELARALRAELAPMRGGEVWMGREAAPEPLTEVYARLLARDDAHLVVGAIDDVVLGFGAIVLEPLHDGRRLGVITDLYVEPGAREVGLGELIADHLLAFARTEGCLGVDALALPGHRSTKNFFEGHGFAARALTMHHTFTPDGPDGPDGSTSS